MQLYGTVRHELKYAVSPADYLALRSRLRAVMRPDPHAGADGRYTAASTSITRTTWPCARKSTACSGGKNSASDITTTT